MMDRTDCDEVRKKKEYICCKNDGNAGKLKLTQPILFQSFLNNFSLTINN
jgi:hypothetical protein